MKNYSRENAPTVRITAVFTGDDITECPPPEICKKASQAFVMLLGTLGFKQTNVMIGQLRTIIGKTPENDKVIIDEIAFCKEAEVFTCGDPSCNCADEKKLHETNLAKEKEIAESKVTIKEVMKGIKL